MPQPPVFVNCRDRLAPLSELVGWLERAGVEEIYLIDNDSAYEPLLEYYQNTPHTVVRLGTNYGKWSLWKAPGVFELTAGRSFVFTDPDVIPAPECPLDALDRFRDLLDRYPGVNKVGFGLRIDDLPEHYRHKEAVVKWERNFWQWPLERGAFYAAIDTTFALHRPNGSAAREAIRTGPPYVARHDSWYLDLDRPTEEEAFYQGRAEERTEHSSGMAHWVRDELGADELAAIERMAQPRPLLSRIETKIRWTLRGRRSLRKPRP